MAIDSEPPDPLVSQHAALTVLTSSLGGAVIGGLTLWMHHSVPESLIAGISACFFSLPVTARLIKR